MDLNLLDFELEEIYSTIFYNNFKYFYYLYNENKKKLYLVVNNSRDNRIRNVGILYDYIYCFDIKNNQMYTYRTRISNKKSLM